MSFVYILRSVKTGKYYIGCAADVLTRLKQHQAGSVISTKGLRPLELVFQQKFLNIKTARKIETKLKALKRRDYIDRIVKDGYIKLTA